MFRSHFVASRNFSSNYPHLIVSARFSILIHRPLSNLLFPDQFLVEFKFSSRNIFDFVRSTLIKANFFFVCLFVSTVFTAIKSNFCFSLRSHSFFVYIRQVWLGENEAKGSQWKYSCRCLFLFTDRSLSYLQNDFRIQLVPITMYPVHTFFCLQSTFGRDFRASRSVSFLPQCTRAFLWRCHQSPGRTFFCIFFTCDLY